MEKPAPCEVPVNDLIRRRWSPRAFESRPVEPEKLRSFFEAARWAASTMNSQPWHFIVATKDDADNFSRVLQTFVENNQAWAKNAPVIGLSVAATNFANNGKPNRVALHDMGQADAFLALEAVSLGLQLHQMGGILPDKAREIFGVPQGYEVVAGWALGYPGDPNSLPDNLREREVAARQRKAASEFVYSGRWGEVAALVKPKD